MAAAQKSIVRPKSKKVRVGSGSPKKALSRFAFNKWFLLAGVCVIGVIGSVMLLLSHAATTQTPCNNIGGGHYNCQFWAKPSPVMNSTAQWVGGIAPGTNWVTCQRTGATFRFGSFVNNWWAWTVADNGAQGWVSAVYSSGGSNYGSFSTVPNCNSIHGTPPNETRPDGSSRCTTLPQSTGSRASWTNSAGLSDYNGCVNYVMNHESKWCYTIIEGTSSCPASRTAASVPICSHAGGNCGYGLCQATPANQMASSGSDWVNNPTTQLKWCNSYANSRYGGWWWAYQFWVYNHWW